MVAAQAARGEIQSRSPSTDGIQFGQLPPLVGLPKVYDAAQLLKLDATPSLFSERATPTELSGDRDCNG